MKKIKHFCLAVASFSVILSSLTSCSVVMAAKKEGTSIEKVQACRSRGQFLACGATVISSERMQDGGLVETYRFQRETGSTARAFMHGALDLSTLGAWEVIGTPIESYMDEKSYFAVRVYYDQNENTQKVELV